jgi:hypothetical protein
MSLAKARSPSIGRPYQHCEPATIRDQQTELDEVADTQTSKKPTIQLRHKLKEVLMSANSITRVVYWKEHTLGNI